MDALLNWLWQGIVVALALSLMLRLLERARANVRYLVCWAALLLVVALPAHPWLGSSGLRPDVLGLVTADAVVSVPEAWWTSSALVLAAWVAWAGVYFARFVWAMVALRRARARSRAFQRQVESLLPHWTLLRGQGRRAELVLSDSVSTAAVLGCGAPLIAVRPSLVTMLDAHELDRVLIHEWAHVQRRDDIVNILQLAVRIVAGWHPAVRWIDRRLQIEREIACDEVTVAMTGSRRLYAECLLKLAGLRSGGSARAALAAPAVLTASSLRARVTRILSCRRFIAPAWSRGIATGVVSALCAVALGVGGVKLVEATAFAGPLESIRTVRSSPERLAAIAALPRSAPVATPGPARQPFASTRSTRRPAAKRPAPATPAATGPEPPVKLESHSGVDSTVHQAATEGAVDAAAPEPSTVLDAPRAQPPGLAIERDRSPWAEAADTGTAIGRKSKDAGVATAGFFTRFARRVAGSF